MSKGGPGEGQLTARRENCYDRYQDTCTEIKQKIKSSYESLSNCYKNNQSMIIQFKILFIFQKLYKYISK